MDLRFTLWGLYSLRFRLWQLDPGGGCFTGSSLEYTSRSMTRNSTGSDCSVASFTSNRKSSFQTGASVLCATCVRACGAKVKV